MILLGGIRNSVQTEFRQLGLGFYGGGCPHTGIKAAVAQVNKILMHFGCQSKITDFVGVSCYRTWGHGTGFAAIVQEVRVSGNRLLAEVSVGEGDGI